MQLNFIRISDELPKRGERVLVKSEDDQYYTAHLDAELENIDLWVYLKAEINGEPVTFNVLKPKEWAYLK